jgi:hypothetical protein
MRGVMTRLLPFGARGTGKAHKSGVKIFANRGGDHKNRHEQRELTEGLGTCEPCDEYARAQSQQPRRPEVAAHEGEINYVGLEAMPVLVPAYTKNLHNLPGGPY